MHTQHWFRFAAYLQHQQSSQIGLLNGCVVLLLSQSAPRAASGLTRPRGGAAGAAASRSGFVPPFVDKALNHHNNNGNNSGGKAAAAAGGEGGEEGPISARSLEMLGSE